MSVLNKIYATLLVVMLVGVMIGYRSYNNVKLKLKASETAYSDLTVKFDSVLSLPPDTIVKPIIIKKDSLVYITKWFNKPSSDAKTYRDSIINDSIDLRVNILAKELFKIDYAYKPIFKYSEKIIERKIPYPVEIVKEVNVPQVGLYLNAGLGMSDCFAGKVGLTFLTKKKTAYSYDFVKYGNKNIHILSYGIKF